VHGVKDSGRIRECPAALHIVGRKTVMSDKEKSGRNGAEHSAEERTLPEEKSGSRAEDAIGSLKESIGIMKKAGERLGRLGKGEVPEQRD